MNVRPSMRGASAGRPLLPALALISALLVGACAPAGSANDGTPVATSSVDLPKSYKFAPVAITVPTGTTVTWTNNDNFTHNVRFEGEEPLMMAPGESADRPFDAAGTYAYICSLHPKDMKGTVVVTGG